MARKSGKEIKGVVGQKIIDLGLAPLVIGLHDKGYSIRKIQRYLKKMGYDIAPQTIQKFLKMRDTWADLRWEEIVASMDRSASKEIANRKTALDRFYSTLKKIDENIKELDNSKNITQKQKLVMKDKFLRTRLLALNSIANLENSLIKKQLLRKIFQDLTTEFVKMLEQLDASDDIRGGIATVLNRVYKKYEGEL